MVAEPAVEKEPQSGVREGGVAAEDEAGWLLVEPVPLDVEEPGQLNLRAAVGAGPAQPLAELVEYRRLRARRPSGERHEERGLARPSHDLPGANHCVIRNAAV